MERDSISMAFVREALDGVKALGGDTEALLIAAGIAPQRLSLPGERVSAAAFGRLWRAVAATLGDEFFGQDGRRIKPGSFATICELSLHVRNLKQALQRALRLFNLLLDDVHPRLEERGGVAIITLTDRRNPVPVFAHETLLILLQGLICWLVDRRVTLQHAAFAYPAPSWADEYSRIYAGNVTFNAPVTAFSFPASDLRAPVVQTERTLREFLRGAPTNMVVKYRNPRSLGVRLRHALKSRAQGLLMQQEDFAEELGISVSTLRRRLDAEGTSFRLIKDGIRRDMAIRQLQQTRRSLPEIAESLGFAEPSAFHRAFIKWMGISPGQFRQSGSVDTVI
ncbi:AraC family transcriptional regulator [Polycyclovorans algicola]|uniref:AraC family transcriptional regulator n=1 Tax=Polycyclovorans algicola TaxID=616992 RepID=UPI0004A70E93|nr:AraC family transcriptional regulator [Polycyclovorans algicola]